MDHVLDDLLRLDPLGPLPSLARRRSADVLSLDPLSPVDSGAPRTDADGAGSNRKVTT